MQDGRLLLCFTCSVGRNTNTRNILSIFKINEKFYKISKCFFVENIDKIAIRVILYY